MSLLRPNQPRPEVLAMFRKVMKQQGFRADLGNNNPQVKRAEQGTSRACSITRVQQECKPEAVATLMAGEMSPKAVLVKAGICEDRQAYLRVSKRRRGSRCCKKNDK